ncbi:MAG: hypothetical protein JW790_03875 [Dehalococcoidales bacterium]|nr:hypothetical protein [Dehalococcoidales bacterium]
MADDEIKQSQDPAPEGEAPEDGVSRISELEERLARQDEALESAQARTAELEEALSQAETALKASREALSEAVAGYRAQVVAANPEIPEEMISGGSIEAVDRSLAEAKSLISRVKQGLEAEVQASRVPAGAPQRTPLDLSALSSREKIQYGVRR